MEKRKIFLGALYIYAFAKIFKMNAIDTVAIETQRVDCDLQIFLLSICHFACPRS